LLSAKLHNVSKARLLMDTTRQLVEEKYHSDSLITTLNALGASFIVHRYYHLTAILNLTNLYQMRGQVQAV